MSLLAVVDGGGVGGGSLVVVVAIAVLEAVVEAHFCRFGGGGFEETVALADLAAAAHLGLGDDADLAGADLPR